MSPPPVRVLVAQGHALFRAALKAGLRAQGVEVVAEACDGGGAVAEAKLHVPDVAVVDAGLPGDGIATCASIKADDELTTRVLILGEGPDEAVLLAAVEAGADGYVDREGSLSELVGAVRRLHAGEACIPPGMLGVLLRRLIERRRGEDSAVDRFSRLSRREKEVFALMVQGLDNRAIAAALVVSPHTARTHAQNVLEKLKVHSRLEAATMAMEYNLIDRFAVS